MRIIALRLAGFFICLFSLRAAATTYYVDIKSTNAAPPYTNWSTAAIDIQSAVNQATNGDLVLVNDGVYTNRGLAVYGSETNCVALTNSLTLLSVNGPQATTIVGGSQTRCAYVGRGAVLMGFTLTNGQCYGGGDVTNERSGGGVWCNPAGVVSNCIIIGNRAVSGLGGGVFGGTVYNSVITNNSFYYGAAALTRLYNCTVSGNGWAQGEYCGGLYYGMASNCVISNNISFNDGAGVYQSVVYNSTITANQGHQEANPAAVLSWLANCLILSNNVPGLNGAGYGAYECYLTNCIVRSQMGIGAELCTNYYCTFSGNSGATGGSGTEGGYSYDCTFTNNSALSGGGASGGAYYNCIFTRNYGSYKSGAADVGSYYNCIFTGNFGNNGGATYGANLYNCTVVGNTATNLGGGVYGGTIDNCILYYNSASNGANYYQCTLNSSCTVPTTSGVIVTNPPSFADITSDFHLQSNSPCINSGNNAYITLPTDFDGNPRIVGGTVDIGAYEYQTPASVISYAYLQQYGLPTDGSVDFADLDGTTFNVYQDWIAGLNPTNPASILAMLTPVTTKTATGVTVTWQSVNGISYFLQRSTNLVAQPPFSTIQNNITGQSTTTSYTDASATNNVPYFYRVGVVAP